MRSGRDGQTFRPPPRPSDPVARRPRGPGLRGRARRAGDGGGGRSRRADRSRPRLPGRRAAAPARASRVRARGRARDGAGCRAIGRAAGAGGRAGSWCPGDRCGSTAARPIDVVHGLWLDEPGAVATVAGRLIRRPAVASVMGGELVALPDIGYGAALGRGGRWTAAVALRGADLVTAGSTLILAAVDGAAARSGRAASARRRSRGVPARRRPTPRRVRVPRHTHDPLGREPRAREGSVGDAPRVFARLAPGRPDLRLDIVGDGSLRPAVEREVERLGLGGRVRFPGQVARARMPDRYRGAALLAVTSRHEGQSMVAVEAAACGLPVVGTRVGVLPDLGEAGADRAGRRRGGSGTGDRVGPRRPWAARRRWRAAATTGGRGRASTSTGRARPSSQRYESLVSGGARARLDDRTAVLRPVRPVAATSP